MFVVTRCLCWPILSRVREDTFRSLTIDTEMAGLTDRRTLNYWRSVLDWSVGILECIWTGVHWTGVRVDWNGNKWIPGSEDCVWIMRTSYIVTNYIDENTVMEDTLYFGRVYCILWYWFEMRDMESWVNTVASHLIDCSTQFVKKRFVTQLWT